MSEPNPSPVPSSPLPTAKSSRTSRELKRVSISLAIIALQRLSDPEVRAQIAKHGRALADQAQQWRAERGTRRPGDVAGRDPLGTLALADRFGRRKLERRVDRLRTSVLSLGEGRPELAESLDAVLAALEEVTSAIEVASLLPFPKRVRAHQKVDRVLDGLEVGLFQAALGGVDPYSTG